MANAPYPRARLRLVTDGLKPIDQPMPLGPEKAAERIVRFKGKIGPDQHTSLVLFDPAEGILAECRLRHPNTRDSWREVIDIPKTAEPEDLFQTAEKKARDWGNHDPRPSYLNVLQRDPGHAPALRELGKIALEQGLADEAVRHLEAACKRDEDSLEGRYYLGLALRDAGRTADARKALELAARYDWEARSLVRLAELRMRERDWHHALVHLDRIAAAHPLLTRPRGLRAACLRKLGRSQEAAAEIASARQIDGNDPFLHYEALFIAASPAAKTLPKRALKTLIDQVRSAEDPLLEAAFDYLAAGLLQEAGAVLATIPAAGMLVHFAQAWISGQAGEAETSRARLTKACAMEPRYQHPWHLEMIGILQWAMGQRPKDPRPVWQLGNLLMARRRTEEAAALWRKAEQLGEKHYLLFASLGYFERHVGNSEKRALACFRKADRLARTDLYVKHETAVSLRALKMNPEGRRYLEGQRTSVLASPRLAHDLMNLYLDANDFKKFDALVPACRFPVNWQIPGPHHLWSRRQIKEALLLVGAGKHREALGALLHMKPMPENLGAEMGRDFEDDRRFYHIGCLYKKLGNPEEARTWWEKALAIPYFSGYEPAYSFTAWTRRYFHALCLQKLGRAAEAEAYFDGMVNLAESPDLPVHARRKLMELVERGRFAPEAEKDSAAAAAIIVATRAEL
jgi:tetratricopeptide (TPR) repeat protein